jgi:hypothetical protein
MQIEAGEFVSQATKILTNTLYNQIVTFLEPNFPLPKGRIEFLLVCAVEDDGTGKAQKKFTVLVEPTATHLIQSSLAPDASGEVPPNQKVQPTKGNNEFIAVTSVDGYLSGHKMTPFGPVWW